MGRVATEQQRHEAAATAAGKAANLAASASRTSARRSKRRAEKAAAMRAVQASERGKAARARAQREFRERAMKAQMAGAALGEKAREAGTEMGEKIREQAHEAQIKAQGAQLTAAEFAERTLAQIQRVRSQGAARRGTKKLEKRAERLATDLRDARIEELTGGRRKRGVLALLFAALGAAAGYVAMKMRSSQPDTFRDDLAQAADQSATSAQTATAAAPATPVAERDTSADVAAGSAPVSSVLDAAPETGVETESPLAGASLAERVRAALDADPRTRTLPGLAINVADGTVFVRGDVPEGTDESVLREVIGSVDGVSDVDLQVRSGGLG